MWEADPEPNKPEKNFLDSKEEMEMVEVVMTFEFKDYFCKDKRIQSFRGTCLCTVLCVWAVNVYVLCYCSFVLAFGDLDESYLCFDFGCLKP